MNKMKQLNPDLKYNYSRYLDEALRVNHAGEYGAKRIYEGQAKFIDNPDLKDEIQHMYNQELAHLKYFQEQLATRSVRPTVLLPIWHLGAFFMGVASAKLGDNAAMACTSAVEEVINEHYQKQIENLAIYGKNSDIVEKIKQFQAEELEHKAIGDQHHEKNNLFYVCLKQVVKTITKAAISLSQRV